MCSLCRPVLPDFGLPHSEDLCPLRNSQYCPYCATYGHLMAFCKAKPPASITQPIYLEQLIAPSDRIAFGIETCTPIVGSASAAAAAVAVLEGTIEIKNDDAVITAYLNARSIPIPRKVSKRRVLEEYASRQGKRVVYIF